MHNVEVPLVFSAHYATALICRLRVDKLLQAGGFYLGEQIYPPDSDPKQLFDKYKTRTSVISPLRI